MRKSLTIALFSCFCLHGLAQDEIFPPCQKCDLEGVKKAVAKGADVSTPHSTSGQSPLAYAMHCPEVTKYLLEQGGEPNGGNYPALVSASSIGELEVMKLLIDGGADVNLKGMGEPPLFKVVQMTNCSECADLLLSKGADVKTKGGIYEDLFRVFATFGESQVKRIVTMKAWAASLKNWNVILPDSYFAQMEARNGSALEMANVLIKYGIAPNTKGYDKKDPMELVQTLLKAAKKDEKASRQEVFNAIQEVIEGGGVAAAAAVASTTVRTTSLGMLPAGVRTGTGGSDLADDTEDVDKIKAKDDWPGEGRKSNKGGGWSVNPELLGAVPKRVALVTFYLEDPGTADQDQSSNGVTTTYSSAIWATADYKADEHVKGFYTHGIDAMIEAFDKNGMELLLPNQFLDTDEKKSFYNNFEVQHGKLKKAKDKSKFTGKGGQVSLDRYRATVPGFKTIPIANEKVNYYGSIYNYLMDSNESAFFQSMGYDLANGLGVDAVVVVTLVTRKIEQTKEDYALNHASMYMFGPNPVQLAPEEDKGLKGAFYIKGQFYCGARVNYTKPVYFQKSGKKGTTGGLPVYNGMDNILTALTDKMGAYFQRRLEK